MESQKTRKNKIKSSKKTGLVLGLVAMCVAFLTATVFVIESLAPINPKAYHKFLVSSFVGSVDGDDTPNSYYQVEVQEDASEQGEKLYTCIDLRYSTSNSAGVKEVWINISDVSEQNLTVFLSKGNDTKTTGINERVLDKKTIKKDKDGWFRIYNANLETMPDGLKGFNGQLKIGFSCNVRLREMVIVDINGKLATIEDIKSCSIGKKPDKGEVVKEYDKIPIHDAKNICDEQKTFKTE